MIQPAVNGTVCVLKGCQKFKVEKCVITASTVTMIQSKDPTIKIINSESWSDEDACEPYSLSKTLAEKAAWEF